MFLKGQTIWSVMALLPLVLADSQPNMPYDLATTSYCTFWYDNYLGATCTQIASELSLKASDLARWNPSLTSTCGNWQSGFSYCIEALQEPSSTTVTATTTTSRPTTTTAKPVVTTTPTWTSLGCFHDWSPRTLANSITLPGGNANMTIQACQKACWSGGYKFAGVELKTQCNCGNSILNELASDGNCKMPCGGNSTQLCGGQNRIFIYKGDVASTTTSTTKTTKPAPTSTPPSTKEVWKLVACYHDFSHFRSLQNQSSIPLASQMTIEGCQNACKARNFTLSGVENGDQCYCDNSIRNAVSNDGLCNTPCTGDSRQLCGGTLHVNIFRLTTITTQFFDLGCYVDAGPGNRTLRNFVNVYGGDPYTSVDTCRAECIRRDLSWLYSGVERGGECWCDMLLNRNTLAPEGPSGCNMPCRGNATQICGATGRMNVSLRVLP